MIRATAIILATLFPAACGWCQDAQRSVAVPQDGLVLWLDASRLEGADGAVTALWRDESGSANHLAQPSAEHQPVLVRAAIGGLPAVRFDGNDSLERAALAGFSPGDQLLHFVLVIRPEPRNDRPSQRLVDLNSRVTGEPAAESRRGFWIGIQGSRALPRLGIQGGDEGEALTACWDGRPHLLEAVYTGEQTFEIHLDGRRERRAMFNGTHFLGLQSTVSLALGQHYGQEGRETYFVGDVAEVLIYQRTLSGPERYALGTSLSTKYSLQTDFARPPQFETEIRPILESRCFECHGEETREAGLDLRTVSSMLRGGMAGPVIVRGHPEYSELISLVESGRMPPEGYDPLTPGQLQSLRSWIEADAPAAEHVEITLPDSKVTEQDRKHWAYQMPLDRRLPKVTDVDRVRNPIDRFVLARLETAGLTLSGDLEPLPLVRRVYFDLIGLPPSPEDVREFLAGIDQGNSGETSSPADAAYERLIDRLLASEHFGERWGRHWLDVAGFVDVHGSDNDAAIIKPHPGKWRYRDYVIRSFNEDKPFDRFVVEQLAGDELYRWRDAEVFTPEIQEALTATAFLLSANDDTSQNELNTPDIRHHVLQRTAENVANTLLAITLECAQCHDHKYEAISQYDYYRFESVFAPIFNVRSWVTVEKRFRPDVSDRRRTEIEAHNARIEADVAAWKAQCDGIRGRHRARLWDERLPGIDQERRAEIRTALETPESQRTDDQRRLADAHRALAVTDADVEAALTPDNREELDSLASQIAARNAQRRGYGEIAVATETPGPVVTHLLRRGNYLRPGLEVEPALLDILSPAGRAVRPLAAENPAGSSGRRLALARELTNPRSLAGNHVARVFVNRLWQQLIGRGIVPSSDNFGISGQPPTHPELLDWLTLQFLRDGWRVKPTIRRIMQSSTYRQTSAAGREAERSAIVDPENHLLWRMNLRRLESEQLRDAVLTVSGRLDRTVGGEPVPLDPRPDGMVVIKSDSLPTPTSQFRRSIYLLARRNYHLTFLQAFDQPILARTCSSRRSSAVVTQALELMNSDFVFEQSEFLAGRITAAAGDSIDQQVAAAYEFILNRLPDDAERTMCRDLVERHRARFAAFDEAAADASQSALAQLCRILLNTTEFVYLR